MDKTLRALRKRFGRELLINDRSHMLHAFKHNHAKWRYQIVLRIKFRGMGKVRGFKNTRKDKKRIFEKARKKNLFN